MLWVLNKLKKIENKNYWIEEGTKKYKRERKNKGTSCDQNKLGEKGRGEKRKRENQIRGQFWNNK